MLGHAPAQPFVASYRPLRFGKASQPSFDRGAALRVTLTVELTLEDHAGALMELARSIVQEDFEKEQWTEFYPLTVEEAFHVVLSHRGIPGFPIDGPVEIHCSYADAQGVEGAWWSKFSRSKSEEEQPVEPAKAPQAWPNSGPPRPLD